MKGLLQAGTGTVVALALVACGGGSSSNGNGPLGGGSSTNPPGGSSVQYNMQAGIANMVSKGLSVNVTMSGTVNATSTTPAASFTGTGMYTLSAAGASTTFNGAGAYGQIETINGTVTVSGQSQTVNTQVTNYYATGDSAFVGEVETSEYDVAQASITWPTSLTGGAGGTLGTVLRYSDKTQSVSIGTAQLSYATTAPSTSGGAIGITLTTKIYDKNNSLVETDTRQYTMTSANVITFVSQQANNVASGNITVTAQ
jgi:hypothetical protein